MQFSSPDRLGCQIGLRQVLLRLQAAKADAPALSPAAAPDLPPGSTASQAERSSIACAAALQVLLVARAHLLRARRASLAAIDFRNPLARAPFDQPGSGGHPRCCQLALAEGVVRAVLRSAEPSAVEGLRLRAWVRSGFAPGGSLRSVMEVRRCRAEEVVRFVRERDQESNVRLGLRPVQLEVQHSLLPLQPPILCADLSLQLSCSGRSRRCSHCRAERSRTRTGRHRGWSGEALRLEHGTAEAASARFQSKKEQVRARPRARVPKTGGAARDWVPEAYASTLLSVESLQLLPMLLREVDTKHTREYSARASKHGRGSARGPAGATQPRDGVGPAAHQCGHPRAAVRVPAPQHPAAHSNGGPGQACEWGSTKPACLYRGPAEIENDTRSTEGRI